MLCSPLEAREGKNLYYAVPSSDTEIKKNSKEKNRKPPKDWVQTPQVRKKIRQKKKKRKGRKKHVPVAHNRSQKLRHLRHSNECTIVVDWDHAFHPPASPHCRRAIGS